MLMDPVSESQCEAKYYDFIHMRPVVVPEKEAVILNCGARPRHRESAPHGQCVMYIFSEAPLPEYAAEVRNPTVKLIKTVPSFARLALTAKSTQKARVPAPFPSHTECQT